MSRETAIEAATKALFGRLAMPLPNTWPEGAEDYEADRLRADATAAIDAAIPHLVGEPVGYVLVNEDAVVLSTTRESAAEVESLRERMWAGTPTGARVAALVLTEEP